MFAIANAHANDRTDPEYYVALSSTLLVAWSQTEPYQQLSAQAPLSKELAHPPPAITNDK